MQKITITSRKGEIIISDSGSSAIDGKAVPIRLVSFDPNSTSTVQNTVTCINMDGQHTVSSQVAPKNISLEIAFDGKYLSGTTWKGGGVKKMYEYRRAILTHIPINETVEVKYENGNLTCFITARLVEIPLFTPKSWLCSVKLYLTADYPFWHRSITGNTFTATSSSDANITVTTEGDIGSPIIGTITCIQKISGNTGNEYFRLRQTVGGEGQMSFYKNLEVGQKLVFNTGLNNEVYIKLIDTDGSERFADDFVVYKNSGPLVNNVGETSYRLAINGTSGELSIQLEYQNLYIGV